MEEEDKMKEKKEKKLCSVISLIVLSTSAATFTLQMQRKKPPRYKPECSLSGAESN